MVRRGCGLACEEGWEEVVAGIRDGGAGGEGRGGGGGGGGSGGRDGAVRVCRGCCHCEVGG